jgi:hypothetical protein
MAGEGGGLMAGFMGGSAPAMAAQIADGMYLLNAATLKGLSPSELGLLRQELEKLQRDTRAIVPSQTDAQACQARNRRIGRLSSALQIIVNKQTTRH